MAVEDLAARAIEAYQRAAGRRWSSDETEASWAAGLWVYAFNTKKASLDGVPWLDPEEGDERLRRAGAGSEPCKAGIEILLKNGLAEALPFPDRAGAASSLLGFVIQTTSAAVGEKEAASWTHVQLGLLYLGHAKPRLALRELKNALDFLFNEWAYKAAGLVSYGGVAAGTRAAQMVKPVLSALRITAVPEAVTIPFVHQFVDDGAVVPNDIMATSAKTMLDELKRTTDALTPLRVYGRAG